MNIAKILKNKQKISMVTCYDYSFARILNKSNIDMILVGDSLANVLLGLPATREVTLDEMLNHTAAVCRGAPDKIVVADVPYCACQKRASRPLEACRKFLEAGADAVKIEWFRGCRKIIGKLRENNIAVMGHIGLTPQTVHLLGGYKVQGRNQESADRLIRQAAVLEKLGVFAMILECIPEGLTRKITAAAGVPTIGIGAGRYSNGQVLVLYDLLDLYPGKPKFARTFSDLSLRIEKAVDLFDRQVRNGGFPSQQESF